MKLPTLFKKTSTGKIQLWEVEVNGNIITSKSGQTEGKKIISTDIIKEGKSIGKKNETTKEQQAIAEAEAKWRSKKKKGYVECITDAGNNVVSDLVEGGYTPMLAHSFDKKGHQIEFPCAAQPKLDGIRGTYTGGNNIWSRTRKEILGVPHIPNTLKELPFNKLDGELYNHEYKDDFETIVHIVKQSKKAAENHEVVQYHVYDIPSEKKFSDRMLDLLKLQEALPKDSPIIVVETVICKKLKELREYENKCVENGYEGAMARNLQYGYEYKRSKHLQKLKTFEDEEFIIIGGEEGRGKLANHLGSFICRTKDGDAFKAKLKGKLSDLKQYWTNLEDYKGKQLTVQFQGRTNKNNVPRFPVGLRIRDMK